MRNTFDDQVAVLEQDWSENPRWEGVQRDYTAADVVRLRGSVLPECSIARHGSEVLWQKMHEMDYVHA
ncbi:MAG: isocitrate lyase, partial [Actinomycetota bacterium]|nr:isocitrate lyase [Actinomycetota bacterium]